MLAGERILMKTLHRSLVFVEGLDDAEQLNLKGLNTAASGALSLDKGLVRTAKACLCMCGILPRQPSARNIFGPNVDDRVMPRVFFIRH